MTIKDFKDWLNSFSNDKELVIAGHLPTHVYNFKIIDIVEHNNSVELITGVI